MEYIETKEFGNLEVRTTCVDERFYFSFITLDGTEYDIMQDPTTNKKYAIISDNN